MPVIAVGRHSTVEHSFSKIEFLEFADHHTVAAANVDGHGLNVRPAATPRPQQIDPSSLIPIPNPILILQVRVE